MVEITYPTFVIDKDICLQNIERMVEKAKQHKIRFRPHFKTHQSAKIGEWFRIYGVDAITVSSVKMAGYFAAHNWDDITIAFPVNIYEVSEINRLAANIKLNILVENKESAELLAKRIDNPTGVFIEIDTGHNRTGILPAKTGIIDQIIDILTANKKITFKGFLTHSGHTYRARSTNEIFSRHFDALLKMQSLKRKYKTKFSNIEISIGDTPSATLCTNFNGIDEIRPGNFVFYDLMMQNLGVCSFKDIAVKVVCPVIGKHISRNEVVIYGGAVHLSKDSIININGKPMFGRIIIQKNGEEILLDPLNYVATLSQEHGILKVEQKQFKNFQVGDMVEIIPVHSCLTANLAKKYLTTEGEEILTANS